MTMEYLDPTRVVLHFEMPLAELIVDYFDQMKSRSQGYASMDYEELGYRPANLVKVDILVNGEPVDALSLIVHRDRAQSTGRALDRAAQAAHPAPDVRDPDPGGHRLERHRPRNACGPCARTCSPSATVATSPASASCSRSRRKASSG